MRYDFRYMSEKNMKYMMRKFIVLFLVTTTIGISACKKYDNDNNTDKSKNVETLKIQSAFNWKTTKIIVSTCFRMLQVSWKCQIKMEKCITKQC